MPYYIRLMRLEDIAQVAEIDREAFPTQWPPPNYRRELDNRLAHYIVICDDSKKFNNPGEGATPEKGFRGLALKVKHLFDRERFFGIELPPSGKEYVVGFAGIWIMADESHITNIAVRESYRRHGIGELLMICLVDLSIELNARFITLEVRTSNTSAQSLYLKYGFNQVGLRRGYYTDNHEDALLMTTENITSIPFQVRLRQLKQTHSSRWEIPICRISQ